MYLHIGSRALTISPCPPQACPPLPLLLSLLNHFSADISARDGNGMTPLSLACRLGHVRVVEVWCTWCLLLQCFIMLCAPCRCWCVWEELIWAHGAPPWARLLCTVLLSMVILTSSGDDAATLSTHNYPPPLCAGCCFAEGQMPLLKMRNKCDAVFLAKKAGFHECRQIVSHHIKERIITLAVQAVNVRYYYIHTGFPSPPHLHLLTRVHWMGPSSTPPMCVR